MNIEAGDTVRIWAMGVSPTCVVKSAINYGTDEDSDWYIECEDGAYWKQSGDGGRVEIIKKGEANE